VDLDHDPNATEYDDQEWIQEYKDEVREHHTDVDGNSLTPGPWIETHIWVERKRSRVQKEFHKRIPFGLPRIADLDHDANAAESDDREWIQEYKAEIREKRTDFDGVTITYTDWTETNTWVERKRSSVTRISRMIERQPIYGGYQIPKGAIVAATCDRSLLVSGVLGGLLFGVTAGGLVAGKAGAAAGALVFGPFGAALGAAAVFGAVGAKAVIDHRTERQVGWEEKWQDWEVVTGFDKDDPPTERKVGGVYLKIEPC
jgi:hypothetical protein